MRTFYRCNKQPYHISKIKSAVFTDFMRPILIHYNDFQAAIYSIYIYK